MEPQVLCLSLWPGLKTCLCLSHLLTLNYVPETEAPRGTAACLRSQTQLVSDGAGILLQICFSSKPESVETHLCCEVFPRGTGTINPNVLLSGCGNHDKVTFDSRHTHSLKSEVQESFSYKGDIIIHRTRLLYKLWDLFNSFLISSLDKYY